MAGKIDGAITAAELAEALGVNVDLVRRMTRERGWPHLLLGTRTVRYLPRHVEEIVASLERQPASPTEPPQPPDRPTYDELRSIGATHRSALRRSSPPRPGATKRPDPSAGGPTSRGALVAAA